MLWSDLERLGRFWDPWNEFEHMQRAVSRWVSPPSADFPAVNVWVSGDEAVVTTEIPGVDPKSIDISVVGKTLTIRGSRNPEELKEGDSYHRRERWSGHFTKTVEMPFSIETSKVEAKFSKGILHINAPRAEAEKPKKIAVKSD
jgi:HSP20 family protein